MKKRLSMLVGLSFLSACATDSYTGESKVSKTAWGAGLGTAAGAGIGALVGGKNGALIGAGLGAATGAGVGGYMDVQARKLRQKLEGTGVRVVMNGNNVVLVMPGNITFDTNKYELKTSFNPILDSVATVIAEFDETKVHVAGYTDDTGSEAVNNKLSADRANAVAAYLKLRGIAPSRIYATGYGPAAPIASNRTAAGKEQNRRVEITLVNMQQ